MSLAKGINAHVGYGGEVTYGTKGTIDLFNRIVSSSLRHVKDPFFSESLNPDWHGDLYYSAGRNEGSIVFEQIYTGLELYWHALFGTYTFSTDTPVASTYTHAFTFVPATNSFPVGISIEDIRGIGGTAELSYLGMMPTKATIEFAPRQPLRVTFDLLGQGTSRAAATATSFPSFLPVLPAHKATFQLGGNTITALSGSIEIEVPRAGDREHYGETLYKEPVIIGRPMASFSLDCEFDDTAGSDVDQLLQDFEDETEITGLVLSHTGDIITGATQYTHTISGTKAFITEATPTTQGQEITKATVNGTITEGLSLTMINATSAAVT